MRGFDEQCSAEVDASGEPTHAIVDRVNRDVAPSQRVGPAPLFDEGPEPLLLELHKSANTLLYQPGSDVVPGRTVRRGRTQVRGTQSRRGNLLQQALAQRDVQADADDDRCRPRRLRTQLDQDSSELAILDVARRWAT